MPEYTCTVTVRATISASSEHAARQLLGYLFDRHITHGTSYVSRAEIVDQTVTEAGAERAEQCVDKQTKVVV